MRKGRLDMSNVKNVIATVMVALVLAAPILYSDWGARYEEETVIIHAGDTLFSLVSEREYAGDIRDSVYRTAEANGLEGNYYLQPGDKLTLVIRKE